MNYGTPPARIGLVVGGTLAYAVIRYVVCGEVPWSNVPVYVANKAISWTGLILFGCSLLSREKSSRRYYGVRAVAATLVHVVLSLMVLNPYYFAKFYGASGRMNAIAEVSMLAGAAGFLVLCALFVLNGQGGPASGTSLRAGWGRCILGCTALHVGVMGFAGWLAPASWPGYLPPITLLSFLLALYFLYARGGLWRRGGPSTGVSEPGDRP